MKISITPISVAQMMRSGKMDAEGFVNYCAELGADGVDILDTRCYAWFWKDRAREFKALPRWLEQAGIKLAAYATGNNFAKFKQEDWQAQVAVVREALREAAELGAPVLRIFGGHHEDNGGEPGMTTPSGLPLIARGIEACLPDAERLGVVLALENHGRLPGHSYEVRMLLDQFNSRFLQCTFDCANFMGANMDEPENPLHAYANLCGRMAHVHVKDSGPALPGSRFKRQAFVAGRGDVPLRQFAALLERDRYGGFCSLEYEASAMVPEDVGVPQSLDYLKNIRAIHRSVAHRES